MSVAIDVHKLEPGALLDLYVLDLNPIGVGVVYYFYNGTDTDYSPVHFQGQDYDGWPIIIEGLEKRGTGAEARPKVTISNFGGLITADLEAYDDLVGAVVKRRRTFAQYLNTETVDSSAFAEELFFIEQKTNENPLFVEFEMASAMDFVDKQIPGRTAVANACPWQYATNENGSGCGWPRTDPAKYFDRQGNSVVTLEEDVCSHNLTTGCKVRFGADQPLDFGGFPSLGRV